MLDLMLLSNLQIILSPIEAVKTMSTKKDTKELYEKLSVDLKNLYDNIVADVLWWLDDDYDFICKCPYAKSL